MTMLLLLLSLVSAAIAKAKQGLATSTQERQQQDEGQQEQSGQHSQHSQQHPQPTYHAHPPYRGRGGRVRGTRAHPQSRGGSTRYPSSYSYSAGAPSSSTSSSIPFKYHHHSTTKPVKKNLTWTAPPGPTPAASEPAAPTEHDESESVVDQTKASASGGVIVAGKDAKGATNNDTAAPDAIKAEPQQPRASASYRTISGSRHRKLVLNGQPTSTTPRPPADTKTSASRAGREVVIGGVTFISDKNGRKLVRRDGTLGHSTLPFHRQCCHSLPPGIPLTRLVERGLAFIEGTAQRAMRSSTLIRSLFFALSLSLSLVLSYPYSFQAKRIHRLYKVKATGVLLVLQDNPDHSLEDLGGWAVLRTHEIRQLDLGRPREKEGDGSEAQAAQRIGRYHQGCAEGEKVSSFARETIVQQLVISSSLLTR